MDSEVNLWEATEALLPLRFYLIKILLKYVTVFINYLSSSAENKILNIEIGKCKSSINFLFKLF